MPITLTHLTDRTFADATHEAVALEMLTACGLDIQASEGTFDARWLTLDSACVALILEGGKLVSKDGTVVLELSGSDVEHRVALRSIEEPLGAGLGERRHVDRLLSRLVGVALHDPERIWIGAQVRIAPGAVIWGGAVLRGVCEIGAATIGPGAVLTDCKVATGAVIKPYSVCQGAQIGPDAMVGPMAHLRPKSRLSIGVKVGNFVEVKNTTLHAHAKASHLSYLGDAEIGAEANIGAGTITCNYDGHNKWTTTVGPGAFIGSNSALVAPVTIGEGAIVAAGSTVNKDIAANALAVARAEQKVLPGMASRIHRKNQLLKEKADAARAESRNG